MVYAAWRKRIPAALTEADAHLGLANRLAAPFARRVFLAYPVPGRDGAKYRVVGRPVRPVDGGRAAEARRRFGLPEEGRVLLVFGGSHGAQALNELAIDALGAEGPAVLHLCGERYLRRSCRRARMRPDYRLLAVDRRLRRGARSRRSRARAGRRVGVGGRGRREAGGARPVAERDRRPPDEERAPLRGGRRRRRRPGAGAGARAGGRARAARRRRAARRDGRGDAAGGEAGRGGRDRRGADRACAPLEGRRIWLVGIGGAGLSAYGLLAHAWGAEVGGWDRNETPYLTAGARRPGSRCACRPSPRCPAGWEVFVSSAYPVVQGRPRADLLAELVVAARRRSSSPARTARRRRRR